MDERKLTLVSGPVPPAHLSVVALGGGTGLSTLLSGLKEYVGGVLGPPGEGITAVVTVTDNGGSSGRLREEFNMLPPGDIRNCLTALAEDEQLLTQLFRYRFTGEGTLGGHSFGNLFLTALTAVTGDFLQAVKLSSEVLAIQGRIYPSTMEDVHLVAELADGRTVEGESEIMESGSTIRRMRLSCPECDTPEEVLEAIREADLVLIGPGSLYSSVIPNLLVPGIAEALAASSAPKVYVCNCMTQPVETDGFTVEDHVRAIVEHAPGVTIDLILANALPISEASKETYRTRGAEQVMLGFGRPNVLPESGDREVTIPGGKGMRAILRAGKLIDESVIVRHDPTRLARLVLDIAEAARARIAPPVR